MAIGDENGPGDDLGNNDPGGGTGNQNVYTVEVIIDNTGDPNGGTVVYRGMNASTTIEGTVQPNQIASVQIIYGTDLQIQRIYPNTNKWVYGLDVNVGSVPPPLNTWNVLLSNQPLYTEADICNWLNQYGDLTDAYQIYIKDSTLYTDITGTTPLPYGWYVLANSKQYFEYTTNSIPTVFKSETECPPIGIATYPFAGFKVLNASNLFAENLTSVDQTCAYIDAVGYEVIGQGSAVNVYKDADGKLYLTATGHVPGGGSSELIVGRYYATDDLGYYFQYNGTVPSLQYCGVTPTTTPIKTQITTITPTVTPTVTPPVTITPTPTQTGGGGGGGGTDLL